MTLPVSLKWGNIRRAGLGIPPRTLGVVVKRHGLGFRFIRKPHKAVTADSLGRGSAGV